MEYGMTYAHYQEKLEKGEFLGLKCNACQTVTFPPSGICRSCNSFDMEPVPMGGAGVLRTYTVIRVAPEGMEPPFIVAMAELDEGPWVVGNLVGMDPEDANTGLIGRRISLGSHKVKGDLYSGGDSWVLTFTLV